MIKHEYPNVAHYVPDLLADKSVVRADRLYHWWIIFGLLIPAALGGILTQSGIGAFTGFLWGGVVRLFVVEQSVSALNSFLHLFGSQPFKMSDNHSRNNVILGILTWGEGWHNNHHAFPSSASFGFKWYQLDSGFWVIRMLELSGLIWDVRRISPDRIEARRAALLQSSDGIQTETAAGEDTLTKRRDPGSGKRNVRSALVRMIRNQWPWTA
jgi:stearoyl-CoA desaturase (delta-9 desaturase)